MIGPSTDGGSRRATIAAIAAALLALTAMRVVRGGNWGEQFALYPDPVEYAASARSIAEEGKFLLHLGPLDVRPMYSPGFPALLAPLVAAGVAGDRLWIPVAMLGFPLALALAATVLRRAARPDLKLSRLSRVAIAVTAAAAGAVWCASPYAWGFGNKLMSEEAALLAALAAVASLVRALSGAGSPRRWFVVAGAALALLAAIRPVNAALLVVGCLPLAVWFWRELGARRGFAAAGLVAAGAVFVALLFGALLVHTGLSPLRWSAYGFWSDPEKIVGIVDFRWSYALEGNPLRPRGAGQPLLGHVPIALGSLFGIPGLASWSYVGRFWPLVGALALPLWAWRSPRRSLERALALSALGWSAAMTLLFFFYSWPLVRYLAGAQWLIVGATFVALARWAADARPGRAIAAASLALLFAGSSIAETARLTAVPNPRPDDNAATRAAAAAWLALSDAQRAGRKMTFDPARAQALGLLDREARDRVGCWGLPIDRYHWVRLKDLGLIHLDARRRIELAPGAEPNLRRADRCSDPRG